MKEITVNGYTRIDKREAFKIFKNGQVVYLAASNIKPSYGNMFKLQRIFFAFIDDKDIDIEFQNGINRAKETCCNKENGKEVYYYKLAPSETTYKLTADFGNKVRLINVMTGQSIDVDKTKAIERMKTRQIEILGYCVDPGGKNIVQYR